MSKQKFYVKGLGCASCAAKIEKEIGESSDVTNVNLSFSAETVVLESEIDPKQLERIIQRIVDSYEDGVVVSAERKKDEAIFFDLSNQWPLLLGTILYISAISTDNFILYLLAYLLTAREVLTKSFRNILKGEVFDENFLMTIATFGAFAIGEYAEAVGVMLFYNVGELFQNYAVRKSRASINGLMDLKQDYANVLRNDELVRVEVEEVEIDDVIVVKIGERVPLDGVVISGISELDTSSISGESLPVLAETGDLVYSGSINITNIISVKVNSLYENSTISKIISLLEESAANKAESELFISRFARIYTPIVVLLALVVGILIPTVFSLDYSVWIYRALVFLVVSCPCALVISVPLAVFAGIGKSSSVGALVKGGNFLEAISEVDMIIFDKTNTITSGEFRVIRISEGINEDLAYAEYYSNHPIARSLVANYGMAIDTHRISDYNEYIGKGIEVRVDGKLLLAGNHEYLDKLGFDVERIDSGNTIVYLVKENDYLGYAELSDTIKDNAWEVISELKSKADILMLSGDKAVVAEEIGKAVGIEEIHSQLLPADKLDILKSHKDSGKKVMFVGDGINDGPVLAESHVGVAMGQKGSDIAKDVADVVLMNDDLSSITKLFRISSETRRIIRQNIVFALIIKIIILFLASFGIAEMWLGVFADVGVSLLAILNSIRILGLKL